mmetsp:Transcript_52451/g.152477  ORF Transcript_52451/g.152477 Transcript_52451/m.152477 type:complete len:235 (-) Transcript_52451:840-1544(-)
MMYKRSPMVPSSITTSPGKNSFLSQFWPMNVLNCWWKQVKSGWYIIPGAAWLRSCSSTSRTKLFFSAGCRSKMGRICFCSTSQVQHAELAMMDAVRLGCMPSITSSPKTLPWVSVPKLVRTRTGGVEPSSSCSLTTFALPAQRMNMDMPRVSCSMMRSPGMNTRILPCLMTSWRKSWEFSEKMERSLRIFVTRSVRAARSLDSWARSSTGTKSSRSACSSSRALATTPRCRMLA